MLVYRKTFVPNQGRNDGGQTGARFPRRRITRGSAPNDWGVAEKSQQFHSTFFNIIYLPYEDLKFEFVGAKLASCPGRHLTSLRPWLHY